MTRKLAEDFQYPEIVFPKAELTGAAGRDVERVGCVVSEEQRTMQQALARLQEYLDNSLAEDDAETAMLGVCNGLLMKMLFRLEESIESLLAECPAGSEHFAVVTRGIEVSLRLASQIHRFGHLRYVLNDAREAMARLTKD